MSIAARNDGLSLPWSAQSRLSINGNVNIRHGGLRIYPSKYAGPEAVTSAVLADYVAGMSDWDIACPDQAQGLTLEIIPNSAPLILIHYRATSTLTRQFGSRGFSQRDCRHVVTKFQTGVVVGRSRGPLGLICVCLRPEGAAGLLGEHMQGFLDAEIGLDAVFGATAVSLLEEKLAEATTSAERLSWVERFLAANLRPQALESVACRAAGLLGQNPHLRVGHLAARLDVSERHLSRSFQAMFGMAPKQFARIARIESVWSARGRGASWADIAYATGFADQSHMVNDFTEIVGVPPAQLVSFPAAEIARRGNGRVAEVQRR
jgi:AraC-like DNA-binding protein